MLFNLPDEPDEAGRSSADASLARKGLRLRQWA